LCVPLQEQSQLRVQQHRFSCCGVRVVSYFSIIFWFLNSAFLVAESYPPAVGGKYFKKN